MTAKPSAAELLADPSVVAGMRKAFEESDVGGSEPVEQGGFILRDPQTGKLAVERLPSGHRSSLRYPICPEGTYRGENIVGSFHTHPNTGPDWMQEPSLQDVRLSKENPETMGPHQFVFSATAAYHIDNEGVVSEIGATAEVLGIESSENG